MMAIEEQPVGKPLTVKERIAKLKYAHNLNLDLRELDKYNDADLREFLAKLVAFCERRR